MKKSSTKVSELSVKECCTHSLSTYVPLDLVGQVIEKKIDQLEGAAWILHDKDEGVEPHIHIYLVTKRPRKTPEIVRWFKAKDEEGKDINTLYKEVQCDEAMHDYFVHATEAAREAGKYQYAEEDIKYSSLGEPWDIETAEAKAAAKAEAKAAAKEAAADDTEQLLQDIIDGVPARQMARRYGRDYIKNHKAYRAFAAEVVLEETGDWDKAESVALTFGECRAHTLRKDAYIDGLESAARYMDGLRAKAPHASDDDLSAMFKQLIQEIKKG